MLVQFRTDIDRSILNGLEEHFCDPRLLDVDQVRLEHAFWRFEPLGADLDDTAVRELYEGQRSQSERSGELNSAAVAEEEQGGRTV